MHAALQLDSRHRGPQPPHRLQSHPLWVRLARREESRHSPLAWKEALWKEVVHGGLFRFTSARRFRFPAWVEIFGSFAAQIADKLRSCLFNRTHISQQDSFVQVQTRDQWFGISLSCSPDWYNSIALRRSRFSLGNSHHLCIFRASLSVSHSSRRASCDDLFKLWLQKKNRIYFFTIRFIDLVKSIHFAHIKKNIEKLVFKNTHF